MSGSASPSRWSRLRKTALARWMSYDQVLIIYRRDHPSPADTDPAVDLVHRDDPAHLDCFEQTERWLSRETFLATCERRIASGEHVYTIATEGRLLAYAWLVPQQARSWFPAVRQELLYPAGAAVLYNAYTIPEARGRGYNTQLARARIGDAFAVYGASAVYTAVAVHNEFARRAKLTNGMQPWLELGCRTRFGRTRTWRRPLPSGFPDGPATSALPAQKVAGESAPL